MNNDVTANVRITEEELEAMTMYWLSVCGTNSNDSRTNAELKNDRALAVARLRYWDSIGNTNVASATADEYNITLKDEIDALKRRGENNIEILKCYQLLG